MTGTLTESNTANITVGTSPCRRTLHRQGDPIQASNFFLGRGSQLLPAWPRTAWRSLSLHFSGLCLNAAKRSLLYLCIEHMINYQILDWRLYLEVPHKDSCLWSNRRKSNIEDWARDNSTCKKDRRRQQGSGVRPLFIFWATGQQAIRSICDTSPWASHAGARTNLRHADCG